MTDPVTAAEIAEQVPGWKPHHYQMPQTKPTYVAPAVPFDVSADRERRNALEGLRREAEELGAVSAGGRNAELTRRTYKMAAKYAAFGHLSAQEIYDAFMYASRVNRHVQDDGQMAHNSCTRSINDALASTPYAPDINWHAAPPPNVQEVAAINVNGHTFTPPVNGQEPAAAATNGNGGRLIRWATANQVRDAVPEWGWKYDGKGRIQRGTLSLFAGRPGVGKSNAARWVVAEATNGRLEGCWHGQPVNVAYIATEEPEEYTVVPGLRAAGADLSRVHFPKVFQGEQELTIISTLDEQMIGEYCLANDIKIVVVDALMTTMGGNTNINQNNEVRAMLTPWSRIAEQIHGIVLGVSHLRKANNGDVVAAINGSSAFGEVARSIFAFAKRQDDNQRIMSQHKNSTGYEDLSLTFELETTMVYTASGECADIAKFTITGTSDETVEDVLSDAMHGTTTSGECYRWLHDYMLLEGPIIDSRDVKAAAKKEGYSERTVQRAAQKLHLKFSSAGMPRRTMWEISDAMRGLLAASDPAEPRYQADE